MIGTLHVLTLSRKRRATVWPSPPGIPISKIRARFDLPKHLAPIRSRQVEVEQNYPRSRSFASVGVLSPMIQVVESAVSIGAPVDAVVDARFAEGTNDGFFVLRAVLDEEDRLDNGLNS